MAGDRDERRSVVACVLLAILAFVLSAHMAFSMAPLFKKDERAHAAYAIALAHGQLPTIHTPILDDPSSYPALSDLLATQDRSRSSTLVWTANHPPLYYALSVPLVKAGDALGHPGMTLLGMRLLDGLGFAVAVLLVGLLARELVPRRPAVAVLASAFALSCGAVTYLGGAIYNDGVATALAFLALLFAVRIIRHGATGPRLAVAAVVGASAASTRASGIPVVAVLCLAVLAATVLQDRSRRGVTTGLLRAVAVGSVTLLAIGWFYLRNLDLYGSMTASSALYEQFARTPNGNWLLTSVSPAFYWDLLKSLWTDGDVPNHWMWSAVVALAVAAVGVVSEWRAHVPRRPRLRFTRESTAWSVVALYSVANVLSVAQFIAGGGWIHARYAVPLLPLLGIAVAVGLLRIARRLRPGGDAALVLPLTLVLVGLGCLCHLDTVRHVTSATSALRLVALVSVDIVAVLAAIAVVRRLVPALRDESGETRQELRPMIEAAR